MRKQTIISRLTLSGCCLALAALLTASLALGQSASESTIPGIPGIPGTPAGQAAQIQSADPWWRPNPDPRISVRPVLNFSDHTVVPATGTMLVRNRDNVFATMHTSGLTAGTAVTFWWAFFNNPHNCATRPCTPADLANPAVQGSVANGGGKIIGIDGTATYGAFRSTGDTTGVFPGLGTGQGLLDPLRAEIHLVTRTHGPANLADPVMLGQQLSLFNGGCPPNTCANVQASIHQP